MKVISIIGPSRGGKAALTPYFSACDSVDLPFNTPDPDWIIESHARNNMDDEGFKSYLSVYVFTYAWYSFLGRHINLRHTDYYSAQNLKPHLDLSERFERPDNDESFEAFLVSVSEKTWIPCFQLDFSPNQIGIINGASDIAFLPVYSRRSPYDLLRAWLVGSRLERSRTLSRMMKYGSIPLRTNQPFINQFTRNLSRKESTVDENGNFRFHTLPASELDTDIHNVNELIDSVLAEEEKGQYWDKNGCSVRFEEMVSNPTKVQKQLQERLGISFNPQLLERAYDFIRIRSLSEALTSDLKVVEKELGHLGLSKEKIEAITELQSCYIGYFQN